MDTLDALEKQMEDLRSKGQLTNEKEVELMRGQLSILKKCVEQTAAIQDENNKLKQQLAKGGGGPGK